MSLRRGSLALAVATLAVLVVPVASPAPSRSASKSSADCSCFEYFRIRPDGKHDVQLSESRGDLQDISLDGKKILFQQKDGVLSVSPIARLASKDIAGTPGGTSFGGGARFSSDATQVAYFGGAPAVDSCAMTPSLVVVGADGANSRTVVSGCAWAFAWSPEGHQVAYMRSRSSYGPSQLVVLDVRNGVERVLAARAGGIGQIAWSPRGDRLAYVVIKLGSRDFPLHVIRADGTHDIMISRGWAPMWSPDGRRIAYNWIPRNGRSKGLAVIARDGSLNHVLDERASHMAWSPDSRELVFASYEEDSEVAFLAIAGRDGSHRRRLLTGDYDWGFGPMRWNSGTIVYTRRIDFGSD